MRTFVILGIVLVVVSIAIAKFALYDRSPAASTNGKNDAGAAPERIACWGFFEIEGGVAQLDAKQPGDVTFVEKEKKPVKAGDLLLQVDDELGQLKVKQLKVAIDAAKLQLDLQDLAVKRVDGKVEELKLKEERDLDLLESASPAKRETAKKLYALGFKNLDLEKIAEEKKKGQINLDLRVKTLQLQEALEMLKHFKITAPSDGSILRANYRKGEILTPNPLKHAIEFLPKADRIVRAEVLQEWGRFVKKGQAVDIEDDTHHDPGDKSLTWKGEVQSISDWYAPTRSPVIEPFRYNDVRTLEIIIKVSGADNVKIGQRVRAMVHVD